jgi:hypothetical protein
MRILIDDQGTLTALYTEALDLAAIGRPTIRRASQVEPTAEGKWTAAIVDGPILGPYPTRSTALAAEVNWLEKNRL